VPIEKSKAKISFSSFKVLISLFLSGVLVSEFYYFSSALSRSFISSLTPQKISDHPYTFLSISAFILVLTFLYFYLRGGLSETRLMAESKRVDLLISFSAGVYLPIFFHGLQSNQYIKLSRYVSSTQVAIVFFGILLLATLLVAKHLILAVFTRNKRIPFLISDKELQNPTDDLLNIADHAKAFSQRLYNGGSNDSIVYGIDAPWGIGKSTFLNFCTSYLDENYKNETIIYRFEPLKFPNPDLLHEKFISGLIKAIQNEVYAPEISSLLSRYSRLIKGKIGLTLFGIRFDSTRNSIDDAFDDLESVLATLPKKVIVIIDDLDRLDFSSVKEVLFSIKKVFALPNLSYVLCYDTENISDLVDAPEDNEKVREFLEKFVNVKFSIFLQSIDLSNYVSQNFSKVVANNIHTEPTALVKLQNTVAAITEIYKSPGFHNYQPYLNDVRKIKRLINLLISLEIESTDFENSDINRLDLIHLLLIYINYPNIFRKIYDTESGGRSGFFSLVSKYDDGYPNDISGTGTTELKNSTNYSEYLSDLSKGQKFLLNKIFCAEIKLKEISAQTSEEEAKRTYACFNGGVGTRNLEQHLNLIVSNAKPKKAVQYAFHRRQQLRFKGGVPMGEIFLSSDFSDNEDVIKDFLKILVNTSKDLPTERANEAIDYLVETICEYSLVKIDSAGIGIRQDVCRYIVIILDAAGWSDASGRHIDNTEENIKQITKKIFGNSSDLGIVNRLATSNRGVLGIYDLLLFRLQCSANRSGSLFNIFRALSLDATPPGPSNGDVHLISISALRKISQSAFRIFKNNYIDNNINFFRSVDELNEKDLFGRYYEFAQKTIGGDNFSKNVFLQNVEKVRSQIKSFSIYQLGNQMISNGIGCGYFDVAGFEDKQGIRKELNTYLFDNCFNPKLESDAYRFFVEYLLLCFALNFSFSDDHDFHRPSLKEFTEVLDTDSLREYWHLNKEEILLRDFQTEEKMIYTLNYSISYRSGLVQVYEILDSLIDITTNNNEPGHVDLAD
jgi:hypothetical protein